MSDSKPPTSGVSTGSADAQLRARVIALSAREASPTRAQLSLRHRIVLGIVMLVPLLMFIAWGGIRIGPRPERLVLQTALGSAVLAAGFAIVGIGRGRSMLGRPRAWLLTQVLLTPALLFGWRVLSSARYPNMMVQWLDRPGFRCFTLSLVLALVPLLGVLWLRRGSDPLHPHLTGAASGAAVGAGVWVLVDLWCPVSYLPHLLLGHVLPLLLLITLAALLGSRIIGVGRGGAPLAGR
ncbi:MAG TPA: NrsF family protein [Polyangiaceae bacterium]|nr:NrsF family protein [Polyangiaceae bacterium]